MGADCMVGFYGIKVPLDADDEAEQEACGTDTDPRCVKARGAGLQTYTGRMTDGEDYFLYIGWQVADIGLEGSSHVAHSPADLMRKFEDVDRRLLEAGFRERAALHFQLVAQY
ncbi:hypothetical protein AACH06_16920 [Ideonella sp. DXS29W]|uniref:Uncharacterized protein n=1 Tax=Ideonella lacteola TaxID=2984193 RepID=A0ABU9BS02_9BURK